MKIQEHDGLTGEVVLRDATAEEIEQQEIDAATVIAKIDAAEEKLKAKNALLERLGITEEEASLLLG